MSGALARPAASADDLLAGLAVRHEAYRRTMPVAAYQAARLASPRERRATVWVAEEGGRVVSTLVCHPLTFGLGGETIPGYGIGSVGTLDAHRGRGHASALCSAVSEAMERAGRPVGLLYAAIAPTLYARLGWVTSPAWAGRCERLAEMAATGDAVDLVAIDPVREAERLAAAYERFHGGDLHLRRDAAAVAEHATDFPDLRWFGLRGTGGATDGGYVCLSVDDDAVEVLEPIANDPDDRPRLLRAVARLALAHGRPAVDGWLPRTPFVAEWFAETPRDDTLPMLRGAPPHRAARFWGSDHF